MLKYGILFLMDKIERFENKIFVAPDGCWLWTASIAKTGYGKFAITRSVWQEAHRVSYELYVGEIPAGLYVDHLCRQRSCVNPHHLELVTPGENVRRGAKTHKVCEHGIGYTRCKDGCADDYNKEYARQYRLKNLEQSRKYQREYQARRRARLAGDTAA